MGWLWDEEMGGSWKSFKRTIQKSLTLRILFVEFLDSGEDSRFSLESASLGLSFILEPSHFPDQVFHYLLNLLVPESIDEGIQEGGNNCID